eukprot:UN08786
MEITVITIRFWKAFCIACRTIGVTSKKMIQISEALSPCSLG